MQVNVVSGGRQAFGAMLYKPPGPEVQEYFKDSINRAVSKLKDVNSGFVDNIRRLYERHTGDNAVMAAKLLVSNTSHANDFVITELNSSNLNTANQVMQGYIMSNPLVGDLVRKDMCHGFQETWVNTQPGLYGSDRSDYAAVMNGAVMDARDSNGEYSYILTDVVSDIDEDLHVLDKLSVRQTWATVANCIAEGFDPTDPELAYL